jgi:hypothetical protein
MIKDINTKLNTEDFAEIAEQECDYMTAQFETNLICNGAAEHTTSVRKAENEVITEMIESMTCDEISDEIVFRENEIDAIEKDIKVMKATIDDFISRHVDSKAIRTIQVKMKSKKREVKILEKQLQRFIDAENEMFDAEFLPAQKAAEEAKAKAEEEYMFPSLFDFAV